MEVSVGRPQSIGEDPVNLAVNNRQSTVLKKEGQLGATKDSVTLDVGKRYVQSSVGGKILGIHPVLRARVPPTPHFNWFENGTDTVPTTRQSHRQSTQHHRRSNRRDIFSSASLFHQFRRWSPLFLLHHTPFHFHFLLQYIVQQQQFDQFDPDRPKKAVHNR